MNRDVIDKVLTDCINKRLTTKCSVHSSKGFHRAMGEMAEKYGLEVLSSTGEKRSDGEEVSVKLYDKKNNTVIQFTKTFVNRDYLDYRNEGRKNYNLEDIFEAYDQLPTKNKKSMNLINFSKGTKEMYDKRELGHSAFIDVDSVETHAITVPDYLFNGEKFEHDIGFVLAHESMHTLDYPKINKKDKDTLLRVIKNRSTQGIEDLQLLVKYNNINKSKDNKKFKKTFGAFNESLKENENILKQTTSDDDMVKILNSSSDYGYLTNAPHENFAEAGAMVITGWKNHDNPSATVSYMGSETNFREWCVFHAPQVKYLVKELYGEDVTIQEVVSLGK